MKKLIALAILSHVSAFDWSEELSTVSCATDLPCTVCNATFFPDEPRTLYPFATIGGQDFGACLPTKLFATPIDFPFILNDIGVEAGKLRNIYLARRAGGPGWVVKEGRLQECEAGQFCPWDATTSLFDQTFPCSANGDMLCVANAIEPKHCSWWFNCKGDRYDRFSPGYFIFLVILAVLLVGLCGCTVWRHNRQMVMSRIHAAQCDVEAVEDRLGDGDTDLHGT